jgi:hypothetical protein
MTIRKRKKKKPNAVLTNTRSERGQSPSLLTIPKLFNFEEDIWSPMYGLNGKIDATVQAIISGPSTTKPGTIVTTGGPKPFEIKTGWHGTLRADDAVHSSHGGEARGRGGFGVIVLHSDGRGCVRSRKSERTEGIDSSQKRDGWVYDASESMGGTE